MKLREHLQNYLTEAELEESGSIADLTTILKDTVGCNVGREMDNIINKYMLDVAKKLKTWALTNSTLLTKTHDIHLAKMIEKIINNPAGVAKQLIVNFMRKQLPEN